MEKLATKLVEKRLKFKSLNGYFDLSIKLVVNKPKMEKTNKCFDKNEDSKVGNSHETSYS